VAVAEAVRAGLVELAEQVEVAGLGLRSPISQRQSMLWSMLGWS